MNQVTNKHNTSAHTPEPWTLYGDVHIAHHGELIAEVLRGEAISKAEGAQ